MSSKIIISQLLTQICMRSRTKQGKSTLKFNPGLNSQCSNNNFNYMSPIAQVHNCRAMRDVRCVMCGMRYAIDAPRQVAMAKADVAFNSGVAGSRIAAGSLGNDRGAGFNDFLQFQSQMLQQQQHQKQQPESEVSAQMKVRLPAPSLP